MENMPSTERNASIRQSFNFDLNKIWWKRINFRQNQIALLGDDLLGRRERSPLTPFVVQELETDPTA
jgi:hypothetical protein